ncbi:hypothetical protein GX411_08885 [Candidatus Fermentibacteria bacterium]|nr:hypothetical protein [Candidatus Fermentibacteria bacterium]
MINRAALIVRPAGPYIEWAASLDDSGMVPDVEGEMTVYLVPDFEDDREARRILEQVFETVFENELFGWHTDESAWPKNRTLDMFMKWFKVELHSVVEDLCDYAIEEDRF